jgi:hypothetical protein
VLICACAHRRPPHSPAFPSIDRDTFYFYKNDFPPPFALHS